MYIQGNKQFKLEYMDNGKLNYLNNLIHAWEERQILYKKKNHLFSSQRISDNAI